MTTLPNAAPPQGALFDDAPTQTTYPTPAKATAALTPAVRIYQDNKGAWQRHDVTMQYGQPLRLEPALKRVEIGRTVFVAVEDAAAVMDAVRGTVRGETS